MGVGSQTWSASDMRTDGIQSGTWYGYALIQAFSPSTPACLTTRAPLLPKLSVVNTPLLVGETTLLLATELEESTSLVALSLDSFRRKLRSIVITPQWMYPLKVLHASSRTSSLSSFRSF